MPLQPAKQQQQTSIMVADLEFSVITSFWRHIIGGASLDFLEPANNVGFSTADSLARSLAQIGVKLGCMCFVRAPNGLNLTLAFQFRAV